MIVAKT